jgi:DNA-directed RNA polymerase specialized sigma24 family protein
MDSKYDNSDRLEAVTDEEWREALDELTAYLTWRLKGKTSEGAHSERVLGMPALDYYQEEAVVKLIEGAWKWQERYTLGKQLVQIATNLITKQVERYLRANPPTGPSCVPLVASDLWSSAADPSTALRQAQGPSQGPRLVSNVEPRGWEQEEVDDAYNLVYALVEDDEELTIFVSAIEHCGNFKDLPEHTGWEMKHVYRLMEKLKRRIRAAKKKGLL